MSVTGKFTVPRRDDRYAVRVPVVLKSGSKERSLYTGDVSFRGLFVCTDDPPVLRQLLTVKLALPPDEAGFVSHGMSVFVLRPGQIEGRLPGVGIQFYAQSDAERRKWERFVTYLRDKELGLPEGAIDAVKRRYPRVDARFEVHPKDLDELMVMFSRDVSSGGMFLETDLQLAEGRPLSLTIYHPITRNGFTIDSIVRRQSSSPQGLGLEFTGLNEPRFQAFQNFVDDGLAALREIDEIEIEIDPK